MRQPAARGTRDSVFRGSLAARRLRFRWALGVLMRIQGKIVKWNDEKGFGFISPTTGGNQVFVHIKAFPRGGRRPAVGTEVTYCCSIDPQGRSRAEKAKIVGVAYSLLGSASKAFIISMGFLTFVAVVSFIGLLPAAIFWIYFVMSLLTFAMYARDKSAAGKSAQRAPENTLHTLALLGGWPGAFYAQQLLRHKSRKASFRIVFWATTVLNIGGLAILLSPYGSGFAAVLKQLKI